MASDYRIDTGRIPWSIAAGALTGATIIAAPTFVLSLVYESIDQFLSGNFLMVMWTFVVAFVVWAIGLVVVGLPLWWLLHKKGVRRWWVAALCGAATAFVGAFALSLALMLLVESSPFKDPGAFAMIVLAAVEIGVYGAIVAAVIWRIAYRRVEQRA